MSYGVDVGGGWSEEDEQCRPTVDLEFDVDVDVNIILSAAAPPPSAASTSGCLPSTGENNLIIV